MPRHQADGLDVEKLDAVDLDTVSALVADLDGARVSTTWPGAQRAASLDRLIVRDAARDDAVTLAAFRQGVLAGVAVLRFPRWDEEHFSYVVGRVEHLQGADEAVIARLAWESVRELGVRGARMCSARVSNDALSTTRILEDCGFRYVELMLAPWRDLSAWEPKHFAVTRPARQEDVEGMCSVARRAFRTDRFHRDVRIAREAADGVYERWVRTWCADGSPSHLSLVLPVDGIVAGFFFVQFEEFEAHSVRAGNTAAFILNAVDPAWTGRGHGFRMYCDALDIVCRESQYCTVDVAAANPAVLNLWAKLGFRLTSRGDVTMHWWS